MKNRPHATQQPCRTGLPGCPQQTSGDGARAIPTQQVTSQSPLYAATSGDGANPLGNAISHERAGRELRQPYFFFSLWTVCFRSRGEYFLTFSFSPPVFRRSV